MLLLIYITAGIIQVTENFLREKVDEADELSFHQCLYFVVVTLSTVGYGDITPMTPIGRVLVMLVILITIVLIPRQTNELLRLMGLQSVYARSFYKANSDVPHIVITGNVMLPALKNFCQELFHPDHGSQAKNAIIL
jgi:hypothetical protein